MFDMNTEIMDMTLIMIMNTVIQDTRGQCYGGCYATNRVQKVKVILFKIK